MSKRRRDISIKFDSRSKDFARKVKQNNTSKQVWDMTHKMPKSWETSSAWQNKHLGHHMM